MSSGQFPNVIICTSLQIHKKCDLLTLGHMWHRKYAIIYLRKYIAPAPGRKGNLMPDPDLQILELLHQLTPEQKQAFLDFAQLLYEGVQVESPSVQNSFAPQDP